MTLLEMFLLLFIIGNFIFWILVIFKKINPFSSAEEKTEDLIETIPQTPNIDVVPKNELSKLPFEVPVPKDKVSGVLFDHDSGTYCFFALSFPELHLVLKTPTNYSQEELERLVLLFTRGFKQKLQVRVFIDGNNGFVNSGIH